MFIIWSHCPNHLSILVHCFCVVGYKCNKRKNCLICQPPNNRGSPLSRHLTTLMPTKLEFPMEYHDDNDNDDVDDNDDGHRGLFPVTQMEQLWSVIPRISPSSSKLSVCIGAWNEDGRRPKTMKIYAKSDNNKSIEGLEEPRSSPTFSQDVPLPLSCSSVILSGLMSRKRQSFMSSLNELPLLSRRAVNFWSTDF